MHSRIINFLDSNNSLYDMQYGFRSGRSCEHALLKAQHILLESLSKKQISLLLLIDFSKAFDMVEHTILLRKLEHYGIRGLALKWMHSYLKNRSQFVRLSGENSSIKHMQYCVPQGSILRPLLFIIYINDLPNIFNRAKFILYADDANIIINVQISQIYYNSSMHYVSFYQIGCIQYTLSSRARLAECAREQRYLAYNQIG